MVRLSPRLSISVDRKSVPVHEADQRTSPITMRHLVVLRVDGGVGLGQGLVIQDERIPR